MNTLNFTTKKDYVLSSVPRPLKFRVLSLKLTKKQEGTHCAKKGWTPGKRRVRSPKALPQSPTRNVTGSLGRATLSISHTLRWPVTCEVSWQCPAQWWTWQSLVLSLVAEIDFILVKPSTLAVAKSHWPRRVHRLLCSLLAGFPRRCSYVVQVCFTPRKEHGCPEARGHLASAPSMSQQTMQHGRRSSWKRPTVLCFGWEPMGVYHLSLLFPLAEPAPPPPAPSMLTQVKVSGSWQHLNLSCWPKLKLNNLLFTALSNQVSEPSLRRYLFSYASKCILWKMLSHFVSLFWCCGLAQALRYLISACSFSTQEQMSKVVSVQTECAFVWDVLIRAALECKYNMPGSIYRRGWGCSIHLHIIIVIRKSNFPCLRVLLLLLEAMKKGDSKQGVCQEGGSGVKDIQTEGRKWHKPQRWL